MVTKKSTYGAYLNFKEFLLNSYWPVPWHNNTRGQLHLVTCQSQTVWKVVTFVM
jgi:hypothetical protein